eukprot:gene14388-15885_t
MEELSLQYLDSLKGNFLSNKQNILALNAGVKHGPDDLLLSKVHQEKVGHVFSHKVTEVKPITNQKSSGRCWIFALLNVIRQHCQAYFNVEDLEFSQTSPMGDGGQWSMLVNLVEKYGLMPKSAHSEAYTSTNSRSMNTILSDKLRESCIILREMVKSGKTDKEIDAEIDRLMNQAYKVCAICLGIPPESFDWEYYDKNKKYKCIRNITPHDFYHQHIKPIFNMEDKVVLVNDPRPHNEYNKLFTVAYLNNMTDGRPALYVNQPVEILKKYAIKSLRNNESVWFGNDVGKHLERKKGAMDLNLHDYELVFGFSMLGLTKAQRLMCGMSMMTHAMAFTGINIIEEGEQRNDHDDDDNSPCKVSRWRVENSWGDESGDKGYYVMTDEWFDEYTYEVVVDKKYLPDEILDVLKQEPIVLPAWDPMGTLAN